MPGLRGLVGSERLTNRTVPFCSYRNMTPQPTKWGPYLHHNARVEERAKPAVSYSKAKAEIHEGWVKFWTSRGMKLPVVPPCRLIMPLHECVFFQHDYIHIN